MAKANRSSNVGSPILKDGVMVTAGEHGNKIKAFIFVAKSDKDCIRR